MSCCNANGCRGLYYAWETITRRRGADAQVNLLLNRSAPWLDVESRLPYEGKALIRNKICSRVSIRIPAWARLGDVRLQVNGQDRPSRFAGRYVIADGLRPADTVELDLPIPEETFQRTAHARTEHETLYTVRVRGNTVLDISPRDEDPQHYPLYQRDHLKATRHAPSKRITRHVASAVPPW